MDRNTAVVPKQQLGFYNFVARPMFEALDGLVSMAEPLGHVSDVHGGHAHGRVRLNHQISSISDGGGKQRAADGSISICLQSQLRIRLQSQLLCRAGRGLRNAEEGTAAGRAFIEAQQLHF